MNKLENKNCQNRVPLSPLNEEFAIKRKFLIFIYLHPLTLKISKS